MLKKFIERPVLSAVVSAVLLLLGFIGLKSLPLTEYPDIAPPVVRIQTTYIGASAETMIESVIIPLEEEINGVDGMNYIKSSANNDGTAVINVYFEQGYDPDIAAINVQNRISRAYSVLPEEVIKSGVTVQKIENTALVWFGMISRNEQHDVTFIENYLNINIKPELQRIKGIGYIEVLSNRTYSMRIWIDPIKMKSLELSVEDVLAAINEQSTEASAGSIGQNNGKPFEYVIKYKGKYSKVEEYQDIIVKAEVDGHIVRLKDIADIELDAYSYARATQTQGKPGFSIGLFQTPGSNAQKVIEQAHETMQRLKMDFPEGLDYVVTYDTNEFLSASIDQVIMTLVEAFILVFIVVYLFLQSIKTTFIPAISVPVSIIGTFFFLNLLGYSINLLTMFSLILSIGIVVDDAIVVVEAIHSKITTTNLSAKEASIKVMDEISGALVSITLVMAAVFVPVMFIKGPTGVFYEQFGITILIAVLISAVNALTISPALCAILFKGERKKQAKSRGFLVRFFDYFNMAYERLSAKYMKALSKMFKYKWIAPLLLIFAVFIIWWSNSTTPKGFVPTEDRSVIFANIELPAGSSLDRTYYVTEKIYNTIDTVPGIRSGALVNGQNFFSGVGSSYSMIFIMLDNWSDRQSPEMSVPNLVTRLNNAVKTIPEAKVIFFTPPSVPGFGSADGFEVQLLDKKSGEIASFGKHADEFVSKLNNHPAIAFASQSFNDDFPQYELSLDIERIKEAGFTADQVFLALQGYLGGIYVTNFSEFGKQYKVMVQSHPKYRDEVSDLEAIYVKNHSGVSSPVTNFIDLKRVYGPQSLNRFNLYNAISINGGAAKGYSSGEAIDAVQTIAKTDLPDQYDIAFSGISLEEIKSEGQSQIILILSIVFVYFFLAAQFESFFLPLAVLFSLVVGIAGAFITTKLTGLELNIYFNIALVMLVGLLAKNAILIVEYAQHYFEQGNSIFHSAMRAAKLRLRPILMTSMAFVVGLLPLVFASGVGEHGNNSIGTGAAGGMFIGTLIGLLIIPILYWVFQNIDVWVQKRLSKEEI